MSLQAVFRLLASSALFIDCMRLCILSAIFDMEKEAPTKGAEPKLRYHVLCGLLDKDHQEHFL